MIDVPQKMRRSTLRTRKPNTVRHVLVAAVLAIAGTALTTGCQDDPVTHSPLAPVSREALMEMAVEVAMDKHMDFISIGQPRIAMSVAGDVNIDAPMLAAYAEVMEKRQEAPAIDCKNLGLALDQPCDGDPDVVEVSLGSVRTNSDGNFVVGMSTIWICQPGTGPGCWMYHVMTFRQDEADWTLVDYNRYDG